MLKFDKSLLVIPSRTFLGISFVFVGVSILYALRVSNIPKPFSGDAVATIFYIKAYLWMLVGVVCPALNIKMKTAIICGIVIILTGSLLLFVCTFL